MPKDYRVRLDDIVYCLDRLASLCHGLDYHELCADLTRQEAILRNLDVIAISVSRLPAAFINEHPEIDWGKVCGLRNILDHDYLMVDLEIVWDVLKSKIPPFEAKIRAIHTD